MIHRIETETKSIYELDTEPLRIRRLSGVKPPTPRQGLDGVWRDAAQVTLFGDGLLIRWAADDVKYTLTSPVIHADPPLNLESPW